MADWCLFILQLLLYNDITNVTFLFKDYNTQEGYITGCKEFRKNENKAVMKAWKEATTCLMCVARKCGVKAFVHVPMKWKNRECPTPEPVIKMTRDGQSSCWMEERDVSIQIQVVIPGGWKSQREFSIIQYEIIRRASVTPNMTLAQLKAS